MAYQGKHTGSTIDEQISRVIDGSVVTGNTLHEVTSDDTKPVTGEAVIKAIDTKAEEKGYTLRARIDYGYTVTFVSADAEANTAVMDRLSADYDADRNVLSRRAVTIGCKPASIKRAQTCRLSVVHYEYLTTNNFRFAAEYSDYNNLYRYIIYAFKESGSSTWTMEVDSHVKATFPILDDNGKVKGENLDEPVQQILLDNTASVVTSDGKEPVSGEAVAKELEDVARLDDGKLPIDNLHAPMLIFEVMYNLSNPSVPLSYATSVAGEVAKKLYDMQTDPRRTIRTTVMLVMQSPDADIIYRVPLSYLNGAWRGAVPDRLLTYESALLGAEAVQSTNLLCVEITLSEATDGSIGMASKVSRMWVTSDQYRDEMQGLVYAKQEQSFTPEEQAQARKNIGVDVELAKKANTSEYYPEMAVGTADNLRGRGEATEEIFTYRPSAGATDNISEEGVATMKRIKGNTVVWNQKIMNGNFVDNPNSDALPNGWENGDYYITLRATISYPSEGGIKFVFNKGEATTNNIFAKLSSFSGIIAGHKYLISCDYSTNGISTTSAPNEWFAIGDPLGNAHRTYLKNTDGAKSKLEVIKSFSVASETFAIQSVRGYVEGAELWIDNLMLIDLTQMFGAGNEPATVEEFYERMPMSIDPYAYNKGELLSVNVESIVTNGFNQFNGEYAEVLPNNTYYLGGEYTSIGFTEEVGGTIEEIVLAEDRLYTPSTKGYIYALGTNININLSHSGVRDGEYEPYEERVHEIPEIAQYFPEGMRSAGSVYDEMTESEVIQRVGVVDLGSLTWGYSSTHGVFYVTGDSAIFKNRGALLSSEYEFTNKNQDTLENMQMSSINYFGTGSIMFKNTQYTDAISFKTAMQGVMLNYELAEHIEKALPTRAINLNYPVWDWGTERAVSAKPSAPFRADIVYGFNAVDTIRMNKSDIEALFKRVVALEAKVAESEAEATAESTDI